MATPWPDWSPLTRGDGASTLLPAHFKGEAVHARPISVGILNALLCVAHTFFLSGLFRPPNRSHDERLALDDVSASRLVAQVCQ